MPAAWMRAARLPCGTSSSSISPALYAASKCHESLCRGNEQTTLRTRLLAISAASPASPLPALLLMMVSPRAPCSMSASISSSGMPAVPKPPTITVRSEEHTSELQPLMRISYAVFCLKKKNTDHQPTAPHTMNTKHHHNLYNHKSFYNTT